MPMPPPGAAGLFQALTRPPPVGPPNNGGPDGLPAEVTAPDINASCLRRSGTGRNVREGTANHAAGRYAERRIASEKRRHQQALSCSSIDAARDQLLQQNRSLAMPDEHDTAALVVILQVVSPRALHIEHGIVRVRCIVIKAV